MAYEIIWSITAQEDFDTILEFISVSQSNESAIEFIKIFYKKLDLLELMPNIGIESQVFPTIRRILITKIYSLLYQVESEKITLIRVINNRSAFKF
jgi:plasmid stabilization system protein ParE